MIAFMSMNMLCSHFDDTTRMRTSEKQFNDVVVYSLWTLFCEKRIEFTSVSSTTSQGVSINAKRTVDTPIIELPVLAIV